MRKSRGWSAAAQLVGSRRPAMMPVQTMTASQTAAARPLWHFLMPPLFVLLWASGFVVTKLGVAFAEPFTFLLYRFVIVTLLLAAIALATGAPWPRRWRLAGHIAVVGFFLQ